MWSCIPNEFPLSLHSSPLYSIQLAVLRVPYVATCMADKQLTCLQLAIQGAFASHKALYSGIAMSQPCRSIAR